MVMLRISPDWDRLESIVAIQLCPKRVVVKGKQILDPNPSQNQGSHHKPVFQITSQPFRDLFLMICNVFYKGLVPQIAASTEIQYSCPMFPLTYPPSSLSPL